MTYTGPNKVSLMTFPETIEILELSCFLSLTFLQLQGKDWSYGLGMGLGKELGMGLGKELGREKQYVEPG